MERDRIRMEPDPDIILCHIIVQKRIRIFSKTNTNGCLKTDFYLDIYLIQLKVYITKFNINEQNFIISSSLTEVN